MLPTIFAGITTLFKGWIEVKKSEQEAEAAYNKQLAANESNWDNEAMRQARFSWKDEFITLVWFTPLIVAWFDPDRALEWINFVTKLPPWYQLGMFGIITASFGLRWFFKNKAIKSIK